MNATYTLKRWTILIMIVEVNNSEHRSKKRLIYKWISIERWRRKKVARNYFVRPTKNDHLISVVFVTDDGPSLFSFVTGVFWHKNWRLNVANFFVNWTTNRSVGDWLATSSNNDEVNCDQPSVTKITGVNWWYSISTYDMGNSC